MDSKRLEAISIDEPLLVTGATGFLGSRTLERLASLPGKARMIASGRTLRANAQVHSTQVTYQLGDLSDREYVDALISENGIKTIIHCAALSSPWGAEEDFFRANVLAQQNLIAAAELHGVDRFIYISTPSLYVNHQDQVGISEADPLPKVMVNAYARTKRQAEKLLEVSGLNWVALRPRALIGRGDTVIMPRILRAYHAGRLRIIGDGKNRVDLTPVSNVVDAILLAMTAPDEAMRRPYNISNGDPVPLWEGISYILQKLGLAPPTQQVPYPLLFHLAGFMEWRARNFQQNREPLLTRYGVSTLARSFSLDITQAQLQLGFVPQQTVWEAIDEFAEWYQEDK